MRIVDIQERSIAISRYADSAIPSGGLTTTLVALVTDVRRAGGPIIGYGFSSIGRFAQGGLIRERFAPRLLKAADSDLTNDDGTNLDPLRAWTVMMAGEKPAERCAAVGTLDMAIWDAAAKIAGLPLHRFLTTRFVGNAAATSKVRLYAGGGYLYPEDDVARLSDELRRIVELGYTHAKIKIGSVGLDQDRRRIEAAVAQLPSPRHLAVDAMNTYNAETAHSAAAVLAPLGLWWFEDICDPLDFAIQASVAEVYEGPIAAGEALFSLAQAKLLDQYGGMRSARDFLLFDPVHCYGLPGYLQIVTYFISRGWPRHAFWPHGGHLFSLHLVAALGLGGAEINPLAFQPFCGLPSGMQIVDGLADLPQAPGIGFELHGEVWRAFQSVLAERG